MASDTRASTSAPVHVRATVSTVGDTTLVRLPDEASGRLPSRGQVAVRATVGGHVVETVVEPDGRRGHWLRLDEDLRRAAGVGLGDTAELTLEVLSEWPEPQVPTDLAEALAAAPAAIRAVWADITPMARWEWVRWVQATANPQTRQRRVEVGLSNMDHGKRRPCCFDLASCTDPDVARSGKLPEPADPA